MGICGSTISPEEQYYPKPTKSESPKSEPTKSEPTKAPTKSEPTKAPPTKAPPTKAPPVPVIRIDIEPSVLSTTVDNNNQNAAISPTHLAVSPSQISISNNEDKLFNMYDYSDTRRYSNSISMRRNRVRYKTLAMLQKEVTKQISPKAQQPLDLNFNVKKIMVRRALADENFKLDA